MLNHTVLTYISRVDANIVLIIASLVGTWIWCALAGGFAWLMFPKNGRVIALTMFLGAILQICNWVYDAPLFVHNANPGPTGLFIVMAIVFFHMAYHETHQRWMLIFSFAALIGGLASHFGYIIFAMIYWGIGVSHWVIRYLKKSRPPMEEVLFFLSWIPVILIFYLMIPKSNIGAGASFKMGTFYPDYYLSFLGLKIANPNSIFSWKGVYWVRNLGLIFAAAWFYFKSHQAPLFVKYLAVAAFFLPIAYFFPGIPQLLVHTISEVAFVRLNNEWNEFFFILILIMTAVILDNIILLISLNKTQRRMLLVGAVLCVLSVITFSNHYMPPNQHEYIQTLDIPKMPIIKYLKTEHNEDLVISETLRAYWIGAQLPSHVYAYMVGRLRTNYEKAEELVNKNEKIWRHQAKEAEIAALVKEIEPAVVLLSTKDRSFEDFIKNPFFKQDYNDGNWAVFSLKKSAN